MFRSASIFAALIAACAAIGQQSPFVREGSIGEVKKEQKIGSGTQTLELNEWVGEKFILLPQRQKLRSFGYQMCEPPLPYNEWVGKTLTVTGVSEVHSGRSLRKIAFKTDDGRVVNAIAYGDTVQGIAPLRDLAYARTRWLGKTLWIRSFALITWNEATQEFGSFQVKKYSPLEVTDVVAGWDDAAPVRLVLKTANGQSGYVDISISGTNVPLILRGFRHFDDGFFEIDPRTTYHWAKEIWDAVESGKVFVGMTIEQARMSWGNPKEINRTTTSRGSEEQWVYGNGNYLYVGNGKVTAVQD